MKYPEKKMVVRTEVSGSNPIAAFCIRKDGAKKPCGQESVAFWYGHSPIRKKSPNLKLRDLLEHALLSKPVSLSSSAKI
jgi:hypothetical protein